MHKPNFSYLSLVSVACFFFSALCFSNASAWASQTDQRNTNFGAHEEAFVFTGTCANNEPYRLVAYQKSVSGLSRSFYDYEGPNGMGTVQSETPPKVMAARVCRKLAEIINADYWE